MCAALQPSLRIRLWVRAFIPSFYCEFDYNYRELQQQEDHHQHPVRDEVQLTPMRMINGGCAMQCFERSLSVGNRRTDAIIVNQI